MYEFSHFYRILENSTNNPSPKKGDTQNVENLCPTPLLPITRKTLKK